jgi:hypothetical protein
MNIPQTDNRVSENTSEEIQARINRNLEMNVAYFGTHPDLIDQRLKELDKEWDVERALETATGISGLTMLTLGLAFKRFRLFPFLIAGFLLQHALQGWCPPLPVIRRMGIRTTKEINRERVALKALRGDFDRLRAQGAEDTPTLIRTALEVAS